MQQQPERQPAGPATPAADLAEWIIAQEARAAASLFGAISATHLLKRRPGFGQAITPAPGSVLASPDDADWDPEPDYFFHWLRDAALVMDAVRLLADWPLYGRLATWELAQYVGFSRSLTQLDGPTRLAEGPLTRGVAPAFLQYVRTPEDMAGVRGDSVRGDVRFNPDASLDISRWSRPQYDGVALRALGLLRCAASRDANDWADLIAGDLDCVSRNAGLPCVDLWEEEEAFHLHTMLTQYAALRAGVAWVEAGGAGQGLAGRVRLWAMAADDLWARLGGLRDGDGWIISRMAAPGGAPVSLARLLDGSVLLGVTHAGLADGPFSVCDPAAQATLIRLEQHYVGAFGLNQQRSADCAPHLGRNPADVYFDGGAWPLITLAAAEFRYRLAVAVATGVTQAAPSAALWFGEAAAGSADGASLTPADIAQRLLRAGDMGFAAVRAVTPADGAMAEQVNRDSGAPQSARHLSWSYAAFLTAAAARRAAQAAIGQGGKNVGG